MATVNSYLNFNGNTEEAFNLYRAVFGGEFQTLMRFKDAPGSNASGEAGEKIMHVSLPISKETVLMGSDVPPEYPAANFGTNISLSVSTDSREETEKVFNGLATGGTVGIPLADQFWGAYFGMVVDKFGIQWMISNEKK